MGSWYEISYENTAKAVCPNRGIWINVVSAYPNGKVALLHVCM